MDMARTATSVLICAISRRIELVYKARSASHTEEKQYEQMRDHCELARSVRFPRYVFRLMLSKLARSLLKRMCYLFVVLSNVELKRKERQSSRTADQPI